jgi:hypothetical protein
VRCEEIDVALAGIVDGSAETSPDVDEHIATCLRCQAELVRYRRLLRALRLLRSRYLEPSPGLLADTLVSLEEAVERELARSARSRRIAYAAAIGGTAVTAAATAAVLIARSRRGAERLAS